MGNVSRQSQCAPRGAKMAYRYRNIIGSSIRTLREQHGLTQLELATKLQLMGLVHLDRGGLAKIEAGTRSVYDYELAIISESLGVTIGALMPSVKTIRAELPKLIGER